MADTATKLGDHIPLTAKGDLTLQICGTSRAGQIVRLKSHKCSIGSGEHCTLRVRGRSVKPLHCVIFRGQADTFVRCWAHDTRLNGQSFSDARLSPGDRIGVGSVEFEVLDPTDKRIHHGHAPDSRETTPPGKPQSADAAGTAGQNDLERLTGRLVLANQQGRARARRLIGRLRLAKDDLARLQQGTPSTSASDDSACPTQGQERQSTAAEPIDRQQVLEEQHRQWEIARKEAEQQLGRRAKELDEQMAQLESRKAALHQQRDEWEASWGEAEEQLVVRAASVDKREAEQDARMAELHKASAAAQTARTGASKPNPKPLIDVSTDDETVEQYMAGLLGRVLGQDAAPKAETLESQPSVDSSDRVSGRPSREDRSETEPDDVPPAETDSEDSSSSTVPASGEPAFLTRQ